MMNAVLKSAVSAPAAAVGASSLGAAAATAARTIASRNIARTCLAATTTRPLSRHFNPACYTSHSFATTPAAYRFASTMKALVYKGIGELKLEDHPKPELQAPTDAIIKVTKTTICGTDLHIAKGDVATCTPGRIIGHEGVGIIEQLGSSVTGFSVGDHVLISCVCSCSACDYCRRGMYSHCTTGGWILGNTIDGTQAEYVRIPHAASSLYPLPEGTDESALVMLSDIFPTGFECGVLNARVSPGSTMALVGSGPVGLAALITAQLYSPSKIIVIDMDDNRLRVAKAMGAHYTINNGGPDGAARAVEEVKKLTDGVGCDAVLEAVGIPASFELCQSLLAPGGTLANVGVHGTAAPLHLEALWDKNVSITTRLVDTVTMPMLLKLVQSRRLDPAQLITHKFNFTDMEEAYATFRAAAEHNALKILVEVD